MTEARTPIRSVAICGGGLVGLSAAIAFARALPGIGVLLIETPADPAALADRLPAVLPTGLAFLDRLGLDADGLIAGGIATHRIATRYVGWRPDGGDVVHVFGTGDAGDAGLHRRWSSIARHGAAAPFHHLLLGGALAERERMMMSAEAPAFALRLDPSRARPLFMEAARRVGVRFASGRIVGAARKEDGDVAAVLLDEDRRASADLFVDATGPAATLAGMVGEDEFEDWSTLLPETRLVLGEVAGAPSPVDRVTRTASGWRAAWPLGDRHLVGTGYRADADDVPCDVIALRPGRRHAPWRRNVLALGDAAIAPGALEWAGLPLAHAGLDLALDLLPGRDMHPLELAEYNRRIGLRGDRVRDFLTLLRPGGPSSSRTLDQFARRGLLLHHEEESFERDSWLTMLLGLGIVPQRADPLTPGSNAAELEEAAAQLAAIADQAPSYPDLLRRIRRITA